MPARTKKNGYKNEEITLKKNFHLNCNQTRLDCKIQFGFIFLIFVINVAFIKITVQNIRVNKKYF